MTGLSGHVIVGGTAGIAMRIVEQLVSAGEQVVVLGEFVRPEDRVVLAAWGVHEVPSTGELAETLTAAGLPTAAAIVCVTGDEVHNLQLALLARDRRPDIRVVAQLGNRAVGQAVAADNGAGAVLDVAALAAPSVVESCSSRHVHPIAVPGADFVAASLPVTGSGTLRELFGDLAPVAVVRAAATWPQLLPCPGRDLPVRQGDVATVLGTLADFDRHGVSLDATGEPAATGRPSARGRTGVFARVALGLREVDRGLWFALSGLSTLVLISTGILWIGYRKPGMSALDALYFSVETVATVGYGDFNFVDQAPWLRLWAILLMLSGITTIAVLMAYLADLLISRRIGSAAGRRQARGMTGHVVVIGLGSFGMRVVADLVSAGLRVVVVERSDRNRFLGDVARLRVPVVFGDATLPDTLAAAGIGVASAVAVMTSDDMVNIETGLAVRDMLGPRWASVPVPLRVFDRGLGGAAARRFGFTNVQPTEEIATPWFVGAALGLGVLGTFSVGSQTFMVGEMAIEAGGGLVGLAMNDLSADTRVIAVSRAATGVLEHPMRRSDRFEPNDRAYLVGPYEQLLGVLERAKARGHVARG